MNIYSITHETKHGTDFHLFRSELSMRDLPSMEDICASLNIDYDEEWEEIQLDQIAVNDLPVIGNKYFVLDIGEETEQAIIRASTTSELEQKVKSVIEECLAFELHEIDGERVVLDNSFELLVHSSDSDLEQKFTATVFKDGDDGTTDYDCLLRKTPII